MKLENKYYNSYIQLLYLGLKEFEYKENDILYRGANISEYEINNLYKFYKNKNITNEFQPSYFLYSRSYLSFSKNKNISLKFIKDIQSTKKVLFQIENKLNSQISNKISNADLYNISFYQNENEILFFPFSSFIIKNIEIKDNIYYINLLYIGIYENNIKIKMNELKNNNISYDELNSDFSKDIFKSEIIPKNPEKCRKGMDSYQLNIIKNIYKLIIIMKKMKINLNQLKQSNII